MWWNTNRIVLLMTLFLACAFHLPAQQPAPQQLSLKDAIALALKKNLGVRVAGTQVEQLEGTRERRKSALLPRVTADSQATLKNENLAVAGISFPGIPLVVGPFSYYDFRVFAQQSVMDRQAYHNWKASEKQVQAAKLNYQDTRDLVVRQAAGLYLDSEMTPRQIEAAESRVTTSEALEKLARDQHDQGLATAWMSLARRCNWPATGRPCWWRANAYQTSLLALARFLGLSPGTPLELAEQLQFRSLPRRPMSTRRFARRSRRAPIIAALLAQRESLVEQQKASRARYFPKLSVNGDYGAHGPRNFGSWRGSAKFKARSPSPCSTGTAMGERKELESRVERLDEQIDDLARGIEQELRKAVARPPVHRRSRWTVTEAALDLAERELTLGGRPLPQRRDGQHRGRDGPEHAWRARRMIASRRWRATPTRAWPWRARWELPRRFTRRTLASREAAAGRSSTKGGDNSDETRLLPILLLAAPPRRRSYHFYPQWFGGRNLPETMLKLSGNIEAHESLVSFKVTGRIVDLPVDEGRP